MSSNVLCVNWQQAATSEITNEFNLNENTLVDLLLENMPSNSKPCMSYTRVVQTRARGPLVARGSIFYGPPKILKKLRESPSEK